jgi:hypothetical protein
MSARNNNAVLLLLAGVLITGCSPSTPQETPTPISYAPSGSTGAAPGDGQQAAKMMNEARKTGAKP